MKSVLTTFIIMTTAVSACQAAEVPVLHPPTHAVEASLPATGVTPDTRVGVQCLRDDIWSATVTVEGARLLELTRTASQPMS